MKYGYRLPKEGKNRGQTPGKIIRGSVRHKRLVCFLGLPEYRTLLPDSNGFYGTIFIRRGNL